MRKLTWMLGIALTLAPQLLFAGELKIIDSRGLTRLIKSIKAPALVSVEPAAGAVREAVVLVNTDGIAADIKPVQENGRYIFRGVGEGTWQIRSSEPLVVRSVQVNG